MCTFDYILIFKSSLLDLFIYIRNTFKAYRNFLLNLFSTYFFSSIVIYRSYINYKCTLYIYLGALSGDYYFNEVRGK